MTHNGRNLEAFLRGLFPLKKGSEPSPVCTEKSCAFAVILEKKTKPNQKQITPHTQTENKPPTNKHQTKKP